MKKRNLLAVGLMIFAMSMCLTACGVAGKVTQTTDTIEVGTEFSMQSVFECKEGVTIALKEGEFIDASKTGEAKATFVISDGSEEAEKEFSFNIVDTQAPVIDVNNITVYTGTEFDPEAYTLCTDNSGEVVTAVVKSNTVDTTTKGEYTVVYEATDSTGNTAEQTVTVTVLSLETPEDVEDFVDEYMTKGGYNDFTHYLNRYGVTFIRSPYFTTIDLDANRTLTIYTTMHLGEMLLNSNFEMGYKIDGITLRMEVKDSGEQSERYNLRADKLTVQSGDDSIAAEAGSLINDDSQFENAYYLSSFHYEITAEDISKFREMLESGDVTLYIEPQNVISDYSTFPIKETYVTIPMTYTFDEAAIESLKQSLEMYDYLNGFFEELRQ